MASERCKNCSRYIEDQIDDSIPKYYKDIHIKNRSRSKKVCLGGKVNCLNFTPKLVECRHCGKLINKQSSVDGFCSIHHKTLYKSRVQETIKNMEKDIIRAEHSTRAFINKGTEKDMKLKLKHENELELLNAYKNHYQNEVLNMDTFKIPI